MNTDTPETDHLESNLGNAAHPILSSFCRKLERQRDEWKAKFIQQNKDLGCEMMDPNGTIWDYAKKLQNELPVVTEQRDDFKKELEIANLRLKGKRHPDDNGIMADGEIDVKAITEQRDVASAEFYRYHGLWDRATKQLETVMYQRDMLAEALEHTMKHMRHSLNCPARISEGLHACNCQMEWAYDNATEALQSLNHEP